MASHWIGAALFVLVFIVTVTYGERLPDECSSYKRDSSKTESLVKAASELRFELRKRPSPLQCIEFTGRVIKSANDGGFLKTNSGDKVEQYRQVVKTIEARAVCLEQTSLMAGGGLRSLLAYMNKCASEIGTDLSGVLELQVENRMLKEQLGAQQALMQQVEESVEELSVILEDETSRPIMERLASVKQQVKLAKHLVASLTLANQALREKMNDKGDSFMAQDKQLREQVSQMELELKQARKEKKDCDRVAQDNWNQLQMCRDYSDFNAGR